MKILTEETVVRYHIEFNEEETEVLKRIGVLPPYAEPHRRAGAADLAQPAR